MVDLPKFFEALAAAAAPPREAAATMSFFVFFSFSWKPASTMLASAEVIMLVSMGVHFQRFVRMSSCLTPRTASRTRSLCANITSAQLWLPFCRRWTCSARAAQRRGATNENCTGLAQIARLGPIL